jgi:hypothetical protein
MEKRERYGRKKERKKEDESVKITNDEMNFPNFFIIIGAIISLN